MNKLGLSVLETDQIFGEKPLKIIKDESRRIATISDYAILSGGCVDDDVHLSNFIAGNYNDFRRYYKDLGNRTGWYWTKTVDGDNGVRVVNDFGDDDFHFVNSRLVGARLTIPFSVISNLCFNSKRDWYTKLEVVEFGEYPGKAATKELQKILEELYKNENLRKTGKIYTRDASQIYTWDYCQCIEDDQKFQAEAQEEYKYNGKKYIRVRANAYYDEEKFTLSNGEHYQNGDYVWVEVEPIKWLVDRENDIALSKKILFAGIQFKNTRDYRGNFENTDLKWFIDTYFSKEIIPDSLTYSQINLEKQSHLQPETRNPIITESNLIHQPGINIVLQLPSDIKIDNIQVINSDEKKVLLTIQSTNDSKKQKIYKLNRNFFK